VLSVAYSLSTSERTEDEVKPRGGAAHCIARPSSADHATSSMPHTQTTNGDRDGTADSAVLAVLEQALDPELLVAVVDRTAE
jgi:hypothetical protein